MPIRAALVLAALLVACTAPQEAGPHETEPLSELDVAFLEDLAAHHQRTLGLAGAVDDALAGEIVAWAQQELGLIENLLATEVPHPGEATEGAATPQELSRHLQAGVRLTEPAAGRTEGHPVVGSLARESAEQHLAFAERVEEADGD